MSHAALERAATRRARVEDGPRLAEIDVATWSPAVQPGPPSGVDTFFRPGVEPGDVLVAVLGSMVAGYVLLGSPTPLPASAHVVMVRGLAVDPACQRRGVGRALVEAALAEAAARGARKVTLRVLGSNPGARRLYEACGFEVEGILRGEFHLDGADVDDVLMARILTP